MRLLASLAVALALAGCAANPAARRALVRDTRALLSSPVEVRVEMEAMERLPRPFGLAYALGKCYRTGSAWKTPLRVTFDRTTPDEDAMGKTTAAHELGHVLGLEHTDNQGEWMFPTNWHGRSLIDHPSARELLEATKCADAFDLVVAPDVPRPMRDDVEWAAVRWNLYLRRPAFTVRR